MAWRICQTEPPISQTPIWAPVLSWSVAIKSTLVEPGTRSPSANSIVRLVYAVRNVVQRVEVFDYRGSVPDTGASTVCRLGESPIAARDLLLARLDATRADYAARAETPDPPMRVASRRPAS